MAPPIISQEESSLTRLFSSFILFTEKASAIVTASGSPSGTATTIIVTATRKLLTTAFKLSMQRKQCSPMTILTIKWMMMAIIVRPAAIVPIFPKKQDIFLNLDNKFHTYRCLLRQFLAFAIEELVAAHLEVSLSPSRATYSSRLQESTLIHCHPSPERNKQSRESWKTHNLMYLWAWDKKRSCRVLFSEQCRVLIYVVTFTGHTGLVHLNLATLH